MINDLKTTLQSQLNQIEGLTSGIAKPDDIVMDDEIYYGYELTYQSQTNSVDYSTIDYSIVITGRLVAKNKSLATMDRYSDEIRKVLQSLRFNTTIQDVTKYDNICKKIINGSARMNDATYFIR